MQAQTGYGTAAAQTAAAYGAQQPAAAAYGAGQSAGYAGQQAGAGYGTQAGSAYGGTTAQGAGGYVGGMSGVGSAYPGQAAASDFDVMGQAQGFGGVYGAQQAAATAAFAQQTQRSTYGPTAQAAAATGSGSAAGFGQAASRMGQVRSSGWARLRLRHPLLPGAGRACDPCTGPVPTNKLCGHRVFFFPHTNKRAIRKCTLGEQRDEGHYKMCKTPHRWVTVRQAGSSGMHRAGEECAWCGGMQNVKLTVRDAGHKGLPADCTWSGAAQFGGGMTAQQPSQGAMGQAAQFGAYGVPQKTAAGYGVGQQGTASGFGRSGAARPAAGAAAGGVAGAGQPAGSYGRASITPAGGAGAPQGACPVAGLPCPLL